jgi:hypothetical protein
MKVGIKKSGNKSTVKFVPSNISNLLNNVRPNPSPKKGSQNPPHFHIKIKEKT